ncbi:hypothetical protein [Sediminibacterium sp.]|uniref:hypothetical protein n=1 Tax=Sediminibacterium sp. TaxID=1917865 RepID=UPI002736F6B2|nr:hypothetical protein [Sediminibacterium sp.]MDP3568743.1 hypothetical protein [Sediminibacterium sp.]
MDYNIEGQGQNVMGKSNVAEKSANVAEVVEVVEVAPVWTIVKDEVEAPRKLTLDERIQRVEDLSLLIDRWKTLNDSRRKLQTFQIGADSLSSVISLRDSNGNEFKTSNSAVITSVIDEMKRTLDVKVRDVEEQIYGKEMIMQSGIIRHACNQIVNPFTLQYHFA